MLGQPPRMPRRTAVLVIHGISPQPRYGIQDEFATQLAEHLNRPAGWGFTRPVNGAGPWEADVIFPAIGVPNASIEDIRPSLLRVHQREPDPEDPALPFIDVYEAYWSPIDKGQTTPLSVLTWMLKNAFVPANTSARLCAELRKTLFDVGYVVAALLMALALTYVIYRTGASAYGAVRAIAATGSPTAVAGAPSFFDMIVRPFDSLTGITPRAAVALLASAVGAYLLVQAAIAALNLVRQRARLKGERGQLRRRLIVTMGLLIVGCGVLLYGMQFHINAHGDALGRSAFLLVAATGSLRLLLSIGNDFLVNRLGDVQIYTTHDENSRFYAFRAQIGEIAARSLVKILRARDPNGDPLYDRVFVAGHSLGSTIAMDMLILVHEMVEEDGITKDEWRRIRALLTFGTSLEKTKFFFDVRQPSISASYQQWRSDIYGHVFTPNFDALRGDNDTGVVGIHWANYWYFEDIVANEVSSYRSAIAPREPLWRGPRTPDTLAHFFTALSQSPLVCQNARLASCFPRHIWVHSDYFTDDAFWFSKVDADGTPYHGALEILLTS